MTQTLSEKILRAHLMEGTCEVGQDISIRIDQTLTQDATGTMAFLQFEAMDIDRVKTDLSVSYIDHNTLQQDYKNPDDHMYLQSVAAKYGVVLSKAGNGICHQVHLERFAKPGKTLLGSDSHTPTVGGIGSIAIGAGGLDVALAMAGKAFTLKTPQIIAVKLTGKLANGVSAKDIILEVLRMIGVKGGVGKILEYCGPAVETLSVPARSTITNMGAETGATTSVFPSDGRTREFLASHGRDKEWVELKADEGAQYAETVEINVSDLVPLVAKPHSPGNVIPVSEVEGLKVHQVCIGSCTNSSYKDLMTAAAMLRGKSVHPETSLVISPGSQRVLSEISRNGGLEDLISSGARILECTCGPCIGQGNAPPSKGVSVRSFNRNFEGRSGTKDALLYLTSVETAVACALKGQFTDPRSLGEVPYATDPARFTENENLIIHPPKDGSRVEVIRGPNIAPLPKKEPLKNRLEGEVLIKVGDNITTDHILPAGKYLPLRSNVPEYAKHIFEHLDSSFYETAKDKGGGFVIGGENYGQGSSREHAALCPMYLGVKAVVSKSFARIHLANLINFGILPLTFKNPGDFDHIDKSDYVEIDVSKFGADLILKNNTKGLEIPLKHTLSERDKDVLRVGGMLNYAREDI